MRYGGTFEGDLEPWYADAFRIIWRDPVVRGISGSGMATFSVNAAAHVEGLKLDLGVFGQYDFRRK